MGATHIAVGNDAGDHYRKLATGQWVLARPGQMTPDGIVPVIKVTVQATIDALEALATIGDEPPAPINVMSNRANNTVIHYDGHQWWFCAPGQPRQLVDGRNLKGHAS